MTLLIKFLELFSPLPGNHYLHVTQEHNEISYALEELLVNAAGVLQVELLNQEDLKNAKPFRALPRDNDSVIFQDVFHAHTNPSALLNIAYRTLANSAELIIVEKIGLLDIEKTKELLEKHEFRTPNHLDILKDYDIIIAKKMHMWGRGL